MGGRRPGFEDEGGDGWVAFPDEGDFLAVGDGGAGDELGSAGAEINELGADTVDGGGDAVEIGESGFAAAFDAAHVGWGGDDEIAAGLDFLDDAAEGDGASGLGHLHEEAVAFGKGDGVADADGGSETDAAVCAFADELGEADAF